MLVFSSAGPSGDPRPSAPEPMSGKTALQYFRDEKITIGINLGNTLDAYNNWENPSTWTANETAWGNITAKQAYFNGLAEQGFKIVRLPVTWFGHIGPAPDYKVSETWLKRVAEVVGYANNAGLKVFINMHHDGIAKYTPAEDGWHSLRTYLNSNEAVRNQILGKYEKAWKQIAQYFINYGDYLMFQGFNELHDGSWDDGLNNPQKYQVINELNRRFTNAVRSTGGNNSRRYLIYYGYNTSYKIAETFSPFVLPNDGSNGTSRQIVGFHWYYPYDFVHDVTTHTWPNSSENGSKAAIDTIFGNFKTKFIDNGVPVIIGESGPFRVKTGSKESSFVTSHNQNRLVYVDYMYTRARENEIVPFYWECGFRDNPYPDSCMNLFNRNTGQPSTAIEVEVINTMMNAINNLR
jgi:endoglucanase